MKNDKAYLKHILDAIHNINRFMKNVTEKEFLENTEKQYAVLRALEIIGEATKNLSRETKADYPEVEWTDIAGMRDKLIHQYFGVDLALVWETVKENLPSLEKAVSEILTKSDPKKTSS